MIRTIHQRAARAFTLIEVMLAIMIFSMVLTAIYSIWVATIKGKQAGVKAAAEVQRSRIAIHALEDAFLTAVMFTENSKLYYFIAESGGDMAGISMVSRLPTSFPGVGRYGDQVVRRVTFSTHSGKDGTELVMTQAPMLLDTNTSSASAYSLTLARDVSLFTLDFWDMRKSEWVSEWINTNQLPRLVRITLGLGKVMGKPQDLVTRVVALPSVSVAGVQAAGPIPGAVPGAPGAPGQPFVPGGQPYVPGQPFVPGQPGVPNSPFTPVPLR